MCAERVAIWKALSEGERKFTELAIVADTGSLTPPCGTCRQIIWEFAKNATIMLGESAWRNSNSFHQGIVAAGFRRAVSKRRCEATT